MSNYIVGHTSIHQSEVEYNYTSANRVEQFQVPATESPKKIMKKKENNMNTACTG